MATAKPKFLHDNRLDDGTPVASSTAAGNFNVLNLRDWRPFTWWKPTALPATVDEDSGVARAADYALIYGHDLHDAQVAVEIRGSTDNFAASDVLLATSNLLGYPQDFSNGVWTKNGTAFVTGTNILNFPAEVDSIFGGILTIPTANKTFTFSMRLTGSGTIHLYMSNSVDDNSALVPVALTAIPTVYSVTHTFNATAGFLTVAIDRMVGDTATQVTAEYGQAKLGALAGYYEGTANGPLYLPFASASYRYWRLRFIQLAGSVMPQVAIAAVGQALDADQYLSAPFDPLGAELVGQFNRSQKGHPLGSVIDFESYARTIEFEDVSWAWYRNSFRPAWDAHLRHKPFAFAWDPENHANEIVLVTATPAGHDIPHRAGGYATLRLPVIGRIS